MNEKSLLINAYKRYGFNLARTSTNGDSLVFTLKTGYFDNAEIIKINPHASIDDIFKEFSAAGYACTVRVATTPEKAEQELFNGFFSVESTRNRLADEYKKFSFSLVKSYGEKSTYKYINAPYQINGKEGQRTVPEEILSKIEDENPILFLIEAAAGFGKTCTAQEVSQLLATKTGKLPLYAELSRNRQARIFRYILLDEIDRTFPLLSSKLVQAEIKNGRVSVILDGFDELLRKGDDGEDFDKKEPMLETISELLTGKAKIIITTRRTILFDGDEFHQWLESHTNDFSVVRIRIQEPKVNDWLPYERTEPLRSSGLDLDAIANPVLLSYLRCIDDELFSKTSENPEGIVQSYFEYMLDRERERQDLRMTTEMQGEVLRRIAEDMITHGYTAEDRDYIIKTFLEKCGREIDLTRNQYSSSDKPTREEIANKLASHALFDRSATESEKIGFVNDFSLGNYVAENITRDSSWLGDDLRFIEPAVKSYVPRTLLSREALFDGLKNSLPYIETTARIEISTDLTGSLPDDLENDSAEGLDISSVNIGSRKIRSFQFSDSTFKQCKFIKSGLDNVTFINCRFFECEVIDDEPIGMVYVLGCASSPEITAQLINHPQDPFTPPTPNHESLIKKAIVKRFWPAGDSLDQKPSRPIYKPLKHLCQPIDGFNSLELYAGIEHLVKLGVLAEMSRSNLISLNIDNINKAYEILREEE